jgi:hypothetical protein
MAEKLVASRAVLSSTELLSYGVKINANFIWKPRGENVRGRRRLEAVLRRITNV